MLNIIALIFLRLVCPRRDGNPVCLPCHVRVHARRINCHIRAVAFTKKGRVNERASCWIEFRQKDFTATVFRLQRISGGKVRRACAACDKSIAACVNLDATPGLAGPVADKGRIDERRASRVELGDKDIFTEVIADIECSRRCRKTRSLCEASDVSVALRVYINAETFVCLRAAAKICRIDKGRPRRIHLRDKGILKSRVWFEMLPA